MGERNTENLKQWRLMLSYDYSDTHVCEQKIGVTIAQGNTIIVQDTKLEEHNVITY